MTLSSKHSGSRIGTGMGEELGRAKRITFIGGISLDGRDQEGGTKRDRLLFYRAFLSKIHGGNFEKVACPLSTPCNKSIVKADPKDPGPNGITA